MNILYTQDTSLDVSFHCSLAPSYPRAIHPPIASSLLPPMPRPVPSSLVPIINPPSLPQPSIPPLTLRACVASLLPLSLTLLSPSLLLSLPPLVHSPTITLLPPLPPLPPSVPPTFYSPSPLPCLTSSLPPSLPPLAPSVPPTFYSPALLPCPSQPACLLTCNSIYTVCVYSVGELHWLLFWESPAMNGAETMAFSRHQQVARGYLGNAPPPRIRF